MKFLKPLTFFVVIILITSCSGYNTLMKSGDSEAKYAEAIRLYHSKKYHKAVGLFENIISAVQGTPREDTMLFYLGKSYFSQKNYTMASEVFNTYRNRFTRSNYTEEAEYLYAMCFYHTSAPVEKDQTQTRQAIVAYNEYLNRYPESIQTQYIHDIIDELTQKLYYKTYLNAALYHKLGRYSAAIASLRAALKDQPEIPYREEMMFLICQSWYDYAKGSVFSRQLDRFMKMTDSYYNFVTAYPESKQFDKQLQDMLAESQEFVQKYGVQSQEAQRLQTSLAEHRLAIEEAKDKLFYAGTAKETRELKQSIKNEREAIKVQKQNIKKRKKEFKLEQKLTNDTQKKTRTKKNKSTDNQDNGN